jgi:hypothetical protein
VAELLADEHLSEDIVHPAGLVDAWTRIIPYDTDQMMRVR